MREGQHVSIKIAVYTFFHLKHAVRSFKHMRKSDNKVNLYRKSGFQLKKNFHYGIILEQINICFIAKYAR